MAARTKVHVDIITKGADGKAPGAGLAKYAIGVGIAAVAVAGLIKVGKELVNIYSVQEQAEARLEATIKSTGKAANLTADQLTDMATGLQGVTKFGDEAIIGAEALLLTFKNIGEDTFPRALESILDVSEAMGTGLKESSIQVGKALNDPVQGITALTRVGITFTQSQKDLIKALVETGDKAGAQVIILEELESQFGGVARAAADTATGSFTQLNNVTGDLKESYGALIAEGMEPFNRALTVMIGKWATVLGQQREAIKFTKDLKDGTIDEVHSLGELQDILAGLEKQTGQAGRGGLIKDEIAAVKILIDTYGIEDEFLIKAADSARVLAQVGIDAALRTATELNLQISAREKLAEITAIELTENEQEIADLQTQIDQWASLISNMEDGADVQDLINELVAQRNEKIKDGIELLEEEGEKFDFNTSLTYFAIEAYGLLADQQADAAAAKKKADEDEADRIKAQIELYEELTETGLTPLVQAFSNVGDAGANTWEVLNYARCCYRSGCCCKPSRSPYKV